MLPSYCMYTWWMKVIRMQSAKVPLRIPLPLLFLAMAALLVFPIVVVNAAHSIGQGSYPMPDVLLTVHTVIIGVIFPVIIGVFYQLGPVAFVTGSVSHRLAFIQAVSYVVSAVCFLLCWTFLDSWGIIPLAVTGTLVLLSLLLFFALVFSVVRKRTAGTMSAFFTYAALVHGLLLVTFASILVWGLAQGASLIFTNWIGAHAITGIYGIFLQFAMAFAYKLIPMFQLSHANLKRRPIITFVFLNVGLLSEDAGLLLAIHVLGAIGSVFIAISIIHFMFEVLTMYKKRIRKQVEWPMRSVFVGWMWIALGTILLALWQLVGGVLINMPEVVFVVVVVGGLVQMITGYLFKIISFLIWTVRYGEGHNASTAPPLRSAIRKEWAKSIMIVWNVGLVLMLIGIIAGIASIVVLGATAFMVCAMMAVREWWRMISPRGVFPPITTPVS